MEQSLREEIVNIGKKTKDASRSLLKVGTKEKNELLAKIKYNILYKDAQSILKANEEDILNARKNGLSEGIIDRLLIDGKRLEDMAASIDTVIELEDPVGKVKDMKTLENGLIIGEKSVPIGVLAIIYEARPNVTMDASVLAIKSSNALILRGGKEAINSNKAIVKSIKSSIKDMGLNENIISLITDTSRESSVELMKLKGYVDLLIPRGSASLINAVVENSKVPTLETGVGNCHIYVDDSADTDMAISIIENAKTTRISVCNAMESLLVNEKVADDFYKKLSELILKYNIKVHGCEKTVNKLNNVIAATEEDYYKEYLDYEMSMKIVKNIDEAIDHISKYSSGHSEVIVTENYANSMRFLNEVDSSCVYVNASSRFTDGGQFGKGVEMGISTQKLHARGPVGLEELVSSKYIIFGNGQIRK